MSRLWTRIRGTALIVVLLCLPLASAQAETIPLVQAAGIYVLPVGVGSGITLKFILDSGASDVTLPEDVVRQLMRVGVVKRSDFLKSQTYSLADGSTVQSARFILHEMAVGSAVVRDVTASVAPVGGPLLLGQSFLAKLPRWSIDNTQHALILGEDRPAPRAMIQTIDPSFEAAKSAYEQGDFATAARFSAPLAEQGNAQSQIGLAFLYFSGQGVAKDYAEAARWYRRAADQGNASGQHSLGRMYAAGLGVRKDFVLAYKWFNLAVSNGDATAIQSRDDLAAQMSLGQITEAQQLCRQWVAKPETPLNGH